MIDIKNSFYEPRMNKKGQAELVLILLFILLVGGVTYYAFSASNPYTQFKSDCEKAYADSYKYNSTCERIFIKQENESNTYDCQKINYEELDKFCLNKYKGAD